MSILQVIWRRPKNAKFKIGQVVKNPMGQFGHVVSVYEKGGLIRCTLSGDMYPYDYPESELEELNKRERGG